MGVVDLWSVLDPVKKPVSSLSELRGKRLAIDVSIWIIACMGTMGNDSRKIIICMRLLRLLKEGIHPVFVLEGVAPALKYATLEKRRIARQAAGGSSGGGMSSGAGISGSPSKVGGLFGELQERWVRLLHLMDLPVVTSKGEAEAACAQLDVLGKVDGVISNDGDALLFGASTIYTNFTCDPSKEGQIQVYKMAEIESDLGLTRRHLVAYALLAGCDYGNGVKGIGKERVLRLFDEMKGKDILQRFEEWREDKVLDTLMSYKNLPKPRHCTRCLHVGNKKDHEKQGCTTCGNGDVPCVPDSGKCDCEYHQQMSLYEARCIECSIRQKAIKEPSFPPAEVKNAFLKPTALSKRDEEMNYSWPLPDYKAVQAFLQSEMNWSEETVRDRLLPVYSGLDLTSAKMYKTECLSEPHKVKHKRVKRFIDVLEVEWNKIHGVPALVAPLLTTEDYDLFAGHFPRLVDEYEREKSAAKLGSLKKARLRRDETPRSRSQPQIDRIFSAKRKLTYGDDKKTVAMSTPSKTEKQTSGSEEDILNDFARIDDSDEERSPPASRLKPNCDGTPPRLRDLDQSPSSGNGQVPGASYSTPPRPLAGDSPSVFRTPPGVSRLETPERFATPCGKEMKDSPPRFATPRKQLIPDTPAEFYTPRENPCASPSKSKKRLHSEIALTATPRKSQTSKSQSNQQPKISLFFPKPKE